jgi:hypothetical protein
MGRIAILSLSRREKWATAGIRSFQKHIGG